MVRRTKHYWLFKSEPDVFGFEHLCAAPDRRVAWDGVRNFQARNLLRDHVKKGDRVLFYHSSCKVPHVAGECVVTRGGFPDVTATDPTARYFDPKASADDPRWFAVEVEAVRAFAAPVTLALMQQNPKLEGMRVVKKGQRLSVQDVSRAHFKEVLGMEKRLARAS